MTFSPGIIRVSDILSLVANFPSWKNRFPNVSDLNSVICKKSKTWKLVHQASRDLRLMYPYCCNDSYATRISDSQRPNSEMSQRVDGECRVRRLSDSSTIANQSLPRDIQEIHYQLTELKKLVIYFDNYVYDRARLVVIFSSGVVCTHVHMLMMTLTML